MATRGLAAWKEPCSSEFIMLILWHGLFRRTGQKPARGNHFRTHLVTVCVHSGDVAGVAFHSLPR